MKLNIHNLTKNAKLYDVNCKVDAQSMNRWVEELLHNYSDSIYCGKYQSVFRCTDIEDKDILIGAAGRLVGMSIMVSRSTIHGVVDYHNEPVFTILETSEEDFQSIPFQQIFALCNSLRDKLQDLVEPGFYRVPLVGGLKSIILSDEPQEIINYYLPEIELFCKGDQFSLFCAEYVPKRLTLPGEPQKETYSACSIRSNVQCPEKDDYLVRMTGVLDMLESDFVQKIVIARKCTVTAAESFDKLDYTAYLIDRYFQEYFYLFRQGGDEYWVGISPEIIMKQQGNIAVTKPLAGTRKKSEDDAANENVRKELISNFKDITEHKHALDFMVNQLKNARIGEVNIDKNKAIYETPYAFHIKSEISIQLKEQISCFDIIGAIYPPATIWGIPVDRIEHILAETEPFSREYFTGFYGYWNYAGDADMALVIRSARIEGDTISVYAGGGIIKHSNPNTEFEETVNKMYPLLSYFVEN